jgi:hypothetical protein
MRDHQMRQSEHGPRPAALDRNSFAPEEAVTHPVCETCGVPMWLVSLTFLPPGKAGGYKIFECDICDAQAVMEIPDSSAP